MPEWFNIVLPIVTLIIGYVLGWIGEEVTATRELARQIKLERWKHRYQDFRKGSELLYGLINEVDNLILQEKVEALSAYPYREKMHELEHYLTYQILNEELEAILEPLGNLTRVACLQRDKGQVDVDLLMESRNALVDAIKKLIDKMNDEITELPR